jgi:hypothetical protein
MAVYDTKFLGTSGIRTCHLGNTRQHCAFPSRRQRPQTTGRCGTQRHAWSAACAPNLATRCTTSAPASARRCSRRSLTAASLSLRTMVCCPLLCLLCLVLCVTASHLLPSAATWMFGSNQAEGPTGQLGRHCRILLPVAGAIMGLAALGHRSVRLMLLPHLANYLAHLQPLLSVQVSTHTPDSMLRGRLCLRARLCCTVACCTLQIRPVSTPTILKAQATRHAVKFYTFYAGGHWVCIGDGAGAAEAGRSSTVLCCSSDGRSFRSICWHRRKVCSKCRYHSLASIAQQCVKQHC